MVLESTGETASHMMIKLLQSFWKTGLITVDQMNRVSASGFLFFQTPIFFTKDMIGISDENTFPFHLILIQSVLLSYRVSSASMMSSQKLTLTCHMPTPSWRPLWTFATRRLSSQNCSGMHVPPGELAIYRGFKTCLKKKKI